MAVGGRVGAAVKQWKRKYLKDDQGLVTVREGRPREKSKDMSTL